MRAKWKVVLFGIWLIISFLLASYIYSGSYWKSYKENSRQRLTSPYIDEMASYDSEIQTLQKTLFYDHPKLVELRKLRKEVLDKNTAFFRDHKIEYEKKRASGAFAPEVRDVLKSSYKRFLSAWMKWNIIFIIAITLMLKMIKHFGRDLS